MGYLLKGVHAIIEAQLNANLEAAGVSKIGPRTGHLRGWIAGARYVLEAVAEAERNADLGETGGDFGQ